MGVIEVSEGDLLWNEEIRTVTWRKTNGNDHFRRQDYEKAKRCYTHGIEVFQDCEWDPPETVREKDRPAARAAAMSMVTDCGSNLSACFLELGDPNKAKDTAQAALEMYPE